MNLSTLLAQRPALLRQLRLTNVAFAYQRIGDFLARAERAQLRGTFTLRQPAPDEGRYWATLVPLEASSSVVEEHFTEEDLMELADVLAFTAGKPGAENHEMTFQLDDLRDAFLEPLRNELKRAGVAVDQVAEPMEEQNR